MQVEVKRLSPYLQAALKSVRYGARDIAVQPATEVRLDVGGGAGQRGFATLVDMRTGRHETMQGSWGGANMFNPQNRVDLDRTPRPLPPGTVLIKGSTGYPRTFATLYAHPDTMASFALPGPTVELSDKQRTVLNIYRGITSSYREEEFRRRGLSRSDVAEAQRTLIAAGLLKQNAAGAIQITTAGKNVASPPGVYRQRDGRRRARLDRNDLRARIIASEWHGGQSSPLYALASSGAITVGAAREIILDLDDVARGLRPGVRRTPAQREAIDDLGFLARYVKRYGPVRGPVAGWSDLHWSAGERGHSRTRELRIGTPVAIRATGWYGTIAGKAQRGYVVYVRDRTPGGSTAILTEREFKVLARRDRPA